MRSILKTILEAGYHPARLYETDLVTYFFLGELLALVDLSTTVKTGVQYSLWGGSVLSLGTEKHRERYCDDIDAFRLPGCFAMTELGHGSNVAGLQTEAVLDVERDEWVISTPDDGALKWWIGNAAEDGQAATVFARLKIPQEKGGGSNGSNLTDHGVHAFVVPIRNGQPGPGNTLPGVEVMDCGYKVGLQGVDNGALRFRGARVPRENLLDRFARVERGGAYSSEFSPGRRFAATLGELTGGRVGLSCSSLAVLKGAVTIAVRYSATRTQFGPPGGAEVAVLDYPSQQEKLMPLLATAYGAHFASRRLAKLYADVKAASKKGGAGGVDEDVAADVHCLSGEREGEGGERRREKREKERENRERKLTFLKKKKKKKKNFNKLLTHSRPESLHHRLHRQRPLRLPRRLRRARLCRRQPHGRVEVGPRHLPDLRGGQHRPPAAGGWAPAQALRAAVPGRPALGLDGVRPRLGGQGPARQPAAGARHGPHAPPRRRVPARGAPPPGPQAARVRGGAAR